MALLAVGGQTKHVGKTTLICNLLRRFSDMRWIAVKFRPHQHDGAHCKLIAQGSGWAIWEQLAESQIGDTARFLQAGAWRSLLVVGEEEDSFSQVFARLQQEFGPEENVIVESSRAALLLRPDLSLLVVDPSNEDFKVSAKPQLQTADALVVRGKEGNEDAETTRLGIPVFCSLPNSVDDALASFVSKAITKNSRVI